MTRKDDRDDRANERLIVKASFPMRCPSCGHVIEGSPELERALDSRAVIAELEVRAELVAWFAEHTSTTTQGLLSKACADVFGALYRKETTS